MCFSCLAKNKRRQLTDAQRGEIIKSLLDYYIPHFLYFAMHFLSLLVTALHRNITVVCYR